jgi:hypothetical protein
LSLKPTTLDKNIQNAQEKSLVKAIVRHHTVLLPSELLLTDGAELMMHHSHYYPLKGHWLVIKLLIKDVKVDSSQELLIIQRFMD